MKKSILHIILFTLISANLLSQNDTIKRSFEPYTYDSYLHEGMDTTNNHLDTQTITQDDTNKSDTTAIPFKSFRLKLLPIENNDYYNDTLFDISNVCLPQQSLSFNPIGATIPGMPFVSARYSQKTNSDFWFLNNYVAYIKTHENVLFFDAYRPYTSIKFYSGGQQQEILEFIHTQNPTPSLNFAFNYNLINWLGSYNNNKTKINALSFTTAYTKHKYQSYFDFIFNRINHLENGGVKDIDIFETTNYPLNNYEVNLNNALNKTSQLGLKYNHELRLGSYTVDTIYSKKDTSLNMILDSKFSIIHEISADKYNRIYKDNSPNNFYTDFFNDPASTIDSTVFRTLNNKIALNFSLLNNGRMKEIKLLTGIENKYCFYKYDFHTNPKEMSYLSNYVFGNIKFEIGRVLVNSTLDYCFAGWNLFDIKFNVNSSLRINDDLYLNAFYKLSALKPDIILHQYSSNNFKWQNEKLSKIFNTNIYADLDIRKWDLKIGLNSNLINNYIIFNYTAHPEQITSPNLIIETFINNTLKLYKFNWFNQLAYQHISNKTTLPLPSIIGYSNFYFKQHLFKKALEIQIGVDAEFRSSSYAYSYMPATGAFYLQDSQKVGNFPILGFNISFKIKKFRGFVKVNNIIQSVDKSRNYNLYKTPYSPFSVNYGICWEFFN